MRRGKRKKIRDAKEATTISRLPGSVSLRHVLRSIHRARSNAWRQLRYRVQSPNVPASLHSDVPKCEADRTVWRLVALPDCFGVHIQENSLSVAAFLVIIAK